MSSVKTISALITLSFLFVGFSPTTWAQPPVPEAARPQLQELQVMDEPEVLDGGPLHEAFASPLSLEAQSIVIDHQPPEPINELPPDERPEGASVNWLPGYWLFDIERDDFVWVSGLWRNFPPGRTWVPGQWQQIESGFQWITGYWADAQIEQQALLPPPPATLEQGPSSPAPSDSYLWAPGCWQWQSNNYAWQPGFWYAAQPSWVWVPNHYSYTPRGVVYVRGYWDYPIARRGLLYAPVYWGARYRARTNFVYRPRTLVNTGLLIANLFLDHNHGRYYYGRNWGVGRGVPSWLTPWGNQSYSQWGRYNGRSNLYDPLWSHFRWDGHSKNGYGKYNQRDLAARKRDGSRATKGDDLFRKVDRLSVAERQSLKLHRNNADELAKFSKHAEKYREFDRGKFTRDQLDKAGKDRILTQRIPQIVDDRKVSENRTRKNGRGNLDRDLTSNQSINGSQRDDRKSSPGQRIDRSDRDAQNRLNAETRARTDSRARVKGDGNVDAQLRQNTQLRQNSQLRQNAQLRGKSLNQQGSVKAQGNLNAERNLGIDRQRQFLDRGQRTNNPQTTDSPRRTFDNQSIQRYMGPRFDPRGNNSPAVGNGKRNVQGQINQRVAKPAVPGVSTRRNADSNFRSPRANWSNQGQSRGRVQQALPKVQQSRGNRVQRSTGSNRPNFAPPSRGRGTSRGKK